MARTDDYAVVVGVSDYPTPILGPLSGPINDTKLFAAWLCNPTGGDVHADNVYVIESPASEQSEIISAQPTRERVIAAFERIFDQREGQPGRRLYIYLSGHGCAPGGVEAWGDAALLMANAHTRRMRHHFPGLNCVDFVSVDALFRQVVLFTDCCRDWEPAVPRHPLPWDPSGVVPRFEPERLLGFGTGWARQARENIDPDDCMIKGVFTKALLAVLNSGKVDGAVLKASVGHFMAHDKGNRSGQKPSITGDLDKIVFSEAASLPLSRVVVKNRSVRRGTVVEVIDSRFQTRRIWQATSAGFEIDLEPGKYGLRPEGGEAKQFDVFAASETDVEL